MPTLRIHTHWQVAQKADTQTKTCQRVCLPNAQQTETNLQIERKNNR